MPQNKKAVVVGALGVIGRYIVEKLLVDPAAHITPLRGSKLWQLAALHLWLDQQGL